jgi:hypothetical protein
MTHNLKKALTSNISLKLFSVILGYGTWYLLGYVHTITIEKTVPLSFYGVQERTILAPETIKLQLAGKRAYLRDLETAELAIHIDGQTLKAGKNNITISNEELFLPNSIKLVHYTPTTIAVYLDN